MAPDSHTTTREEPHETDSDPQAQTVETVLVAGTRYRLADLRELAEVERLLHLDTRAHDPAVRYGAGAARVEYDTWEHNESDRGSLTASVAAEVAHTDAWGLSTIYDPLELDEGRLASTLTVVHDPEGDR